MRKVTLNLKVQVLLNLDDDVTITDAVESFNMNIYCSDDANYDIEDHNITGWTITDSR